MKIDLDKLILDLDGKEIASTPAEPAQGGKPPVPAGPALKLGDVLITSLTGQFTDEQSLDGNTKFERYQLAVEVKKGGERDFTLKDATEMLRLLSKWASPIIYGRAKEIIDPPKAD